MPSDILAKGGYSQVLNSVISIVAVDVMDGFRLGQFAAQVRFHDLTVFHNSLSPGDPQPYVAGTGNFPSPLPIGAVLAFELVEVLFDKLAFLRRGVALQQVLSDCFSVGAGFLDYLTNHGPTLKERVDLVDFGKS